MSSFFTGLEPFRDYLVSTGRRARVVPSAEGLDDGFFSRDKNIIALDGSAIDLVTLRVQGMMGPRQLLSAGAFTFRLKGIPVFSRKLVPIQYHYIVRLPRVYPWLSTKLVQETRGVLGRERVSMAWSTPYLGARIERDAEIMRTLHEHITVDDGLEVRAEVDKSFVRIIHSRASVLETNLFELKILELHRQLAPPALLAAFEKIAMLVRAPLVTT